MMAQNKPMNRVLRISLLVLAATTLVWATAGACYALDASRSTASMMILLGVLGIATFGDWVSALTSCGMGSLAFSYFFVDDVGSFRITSVDGAVTFLALLLTALTASQLSLRAQRRASEAVRRRERWSACTSSPVSSFRRETSPKPPTTQFASW